MSISGFAKAPIVGATMSRGVYCEGSHTASTADRVLIEEAAGRFGHLVPVGGKLTGAQWLAAIAKEGNATSARLLEAIRRVMLVDEFESVGWKSDEERFQQAKIDLESLGLYDAIVHQRYAEIDRPFHSDTIVDLPNDYGFQLPFGGGVGTMAWRVLDVLSAPPVGVEAFTPEQAADQGAQIKIMQLLLKHQGYTCLTAQSRDQLKWVSEGREGFSSVEALHEVDSAACGFFESLYDAGWQPGQLVNLCRPAPLFNPFASIRPFECLAHPELVGWRVPSALVEHYFERIERDRAPGHREREATT